MFSAHTHTTHTHLYIQIYRIYWDTKERMLGDSLDKLCSRKSGKSSSEPLDDSLVRKQNDFFIGASNLFFGNSSRTEKIVKFSVLFLPQSLNL